MTQLNRLASLTKCLSVHLRTKGLWVQIRLQSLKLQILYLFRVRSSFRFRHYGVWIHLKRVRGMIITYRQQHSSIVGPAWLNGWVFVYELSGCRFESRCSHTLIILNSRILLIKNCNSKILNPRLKIN